MNIKELLKKAAIPLLLGMVTLLAFKFIMWNTWKVERAVNMAKHVIKAKPAVNLSLFNTEGTLFKKGFPYNHKGNFYLIRHFDITPYIKQSGTNSYLDIRLAVNGDSAPLKTDLYLFKKFNVLDFREHCFIFAKQDCSIEDFVSIMKLAPKLVNTLYFLPLDPKGVTKENLALDCRLTYGNGRYTMVLSGTFRKSRVYQIQFHYRCTGPEDARPSVMLAKPPYEKGNIIFRKNLIPTGTHNEKVAFRRGFILFSPGFSITDPELHFIARSGSGKRTFQGGVHFKNATLIRHAASDSRSGPDSMARLTYAGHLAEVKKHQ